MKHARIIFPAALLIALALAVAAWLRPAADAPTRPREEGAAGGRTALDASSGSPPPEDAGAPTLPPESLPLSERLPALRRSAEAGDTDGACRLAIEILRCSGLSRRPPGARASRYEEDLAEQGKLAEANREAERQLLRIEQRRECDAAGPLDAREPISLLAEAAARGHGPAAVAYFRLGDQFRMMRGNYLDPAFDAWRAQAPRWLERAAREGNPEAVVALAQALTDDSSYPTALVEDDPARAYLHQRLRSLLAGQAWDDRWDGRYRLDQAARETLAAEAGRLHASRFGGREYPLRNLALWGIREQAEITASDFCAPELSK